jgi:hypothetical protein
MPRFLWSCALVVVAAIVGIGAMSATSGMEYEAGIANQVRGTAHRPYIYRQLVPTTIRAVMAVRSPEQWQSTEQRIAASGWIEQFEYLTAFDYTWWYTGDLIPIFLSAGINLLSLVAFAFVFRAFVEQHVRAPEAFANLATLVTLYLLVHMNREGVYSYDYPLLLLFTLALLLMWKQAWAWYYPVFVLATFNKETTVLLILVFVVVFWRRLPVPAFLTHVAAQSVAFLAIIWGLRRAYAGSPGGSVEYHLLDYNMRVVVNPEDAYGVVAFAALFAILLLRDWESKPWFLRRATIVFWPLFVLTLLFGWIDELRDYYEFYVVAMPLVAMTVARDLGVVVGPRYRDSSHAVSVG